MDSSRPHMHRKGIAGEDLRQRLFVFDMEQGKPDQDIRFEMSVKPADFPDIPAV
ncbi:hypothetical protein [Paenibacillus xylanexedens]|uniref:hypothetical protein n=1 Tax=Paenibacillus xylanexedens TaxID=528191 RepID=UPI001C92F040|nr:hypothetical protein [Paenibacillus xylanexedens]